MPGNKKNVKEKIYKFNLNAIQTAIFNLKTINLQSHGKKRKSIVAFKIRMLILSSKKLLS